MGVERDVEDLDLGLGEAILVGFVETLLVGWRDDDAGERIAELGVHEHVDAIELELFLRGTLLVELSLEGQLGETVHEGILLDEGLAVAHGQLLHLGREHAHEFFQFAEGQLPPIPKGSDDRIGREVGGGVLGRRSLGAGEKAKEEKSRQPMHEPQFRVAGKPRSDSGMQPV